MIEHSTPIMNSGQKGKRMILIFSKNLLVTRFIASQAIEYKALSMILDVLSPLLSATSYLDILKPIFGQVMDSSGFLRLVNLVGMT